MYNEPKIGSFYYHYKHDPNGPINNYAYEVINFGHHTEIDGLDESAMVIYAPLYPEAGVYKAGRHFDVRPLAMFIEEVTKDSKTFPRFQEITDPQVIEKLTQIKEELYG
jgi:hypothetical protein